MHHLRCANNIALSPILPTYLPRFSTHANFRGYS